MAKKRADKKLLMSILAEIIKERKEIETQRLLLEIVNKRLNSKYAISGKRLRKIIAEIPEIGIATKNIRGEMPKACPVCNGKLKGVYVKNLQGKKILVSMKCTRCGYKGGSGKWRVGRYVFYWKPKL